MSENDWFFSLKYRCNYMLLPFATRCSTAGMYTGNISLTLVSYGLLTRRLSRIIHWFSQPWSLRNLCTNFPDGPVTSMTTSIDPLVFARPGFRVLALVQSKSLVSPRLYSGPSVHTRTTDRIFSSDVSRACWSVVHLHITRSLCSSRLR